MNKKFYLLLIAFLSVCAFSRAQTGFGEIRGTVLDDKNKPIEGALVVAKLEGEAKRTVRTDEKGNYLLKPLEPGKYVILVKALGFPDKTEEVNLAENAVVARNISMGEVQATVLGGVVVDTKRQKPSLEPKTTITSATLVTLPQRGLNAIVGTQAGVVSQNGGTPNIGAARSDGTVYFIDGVRVIGSAGVATNMIDQVQVISRGVPAQYGDFIGGAISIRTKGPSSKYHGFAEMISSSPFDKYHTNALETGISGPIKKVNKGTDTERSILGFAVGGNFNYTQDPNPSGIGVWKTKDDVLARLEANPLRLAPGGTGFVPNAEFVTKNDLEHVKAKQNIPAGGINLTGSLNYSPSENINIVVGGQFNYSNTMRESYGNSLFNYKENLEEIRNVYRAYVKFTQSFNKKTDEKDKDKFSLISNAYYTVRFDYTYSKFVSQDPDLKTDFFKYGYIGKFKTYSMAAYSQYGAPNPPKKFIDQNGDTVTLSFFREMQGFADTLYTFQRSDINPIRANYTQNFYDLSTAQGNRIERMDEVRQNLGLVNGDLPNAIYSQMWANPGTAQAVLYQLATTEQYNVFAMGEASVNSRRNKGRQHALQFGLQHEQRVTRSYVVNAVGLWTLARQLVNQQFNGLTNQEDSNGYIHGGTLVYDGNGVFQDTVKYQRNINYVNQKNFDKNLRASLQANGGVDAYGNSITEQTFLDVNSYNPQDFSLTMFSQDELLNNGNSYVNYSGYDAYGNKIKGKPSYDRFLNGERMIAPYSPIYQAAWVQDQFYFRDLLFRIGVRMERFDNNMPVLQDPYSLYPVQTAGEVTRIGNTQINHPGTIGNGYKVYVDDMKNPNKIVGYRDGNNWYNSEGNRINDPSVLANESGGRIQPFLVSPNNQVLTTQGSFRDYTPQVNFVPRILFSFNISEQARLFTTYDVLVQRPTEATVAQVDDYYYLQNRANVAIGNPDLKPSKRTDYELGFRQVIGDNSSLGLVASYSEMRNLITQFNYNQAYPITYTTFGNLDFATVKSFRVEYELSNLGNVSVSANYTLQFADGTGSNSGSSAALIAAGLPNLRTLFPLNFDVRHVMKGIFDFHYKPYTTDPNVAADKKYDGPIVFGKPIFQNAGISLIFNASSGRPYTVNSQPTADAQPGTAQRSPIKGNPNGSRLPWQFFTDFAADKTWFMKVGEYKNGAPKQGSITAFLQVTNLFNAKNIINVYRYSGSPDTDGYLNSPQGQVAVSQATNAQAYVDLYNIKVASPGNYALPRWTRLGVRFNF